jgi:phage host-nuclease inhibitor protein Gam
MNQLLTREAEALPAFIFGQEPETHTTFAVDNDDKAAWAANKVLAAERRIQMRCDLAERYKARIDAWLADANSPDTASIDQFRCMLRPWLESNLRNAGRSRSVKLLSATIGLRKRPDRVEILDAERALEYCERSLPEVVVVKKDLSKTLLKAFLQNGREVPGTCLAEGEDEITIKGA